MCNSDLKYFIGMILEFKCEYENLSIHNDDDLITMIDILKDDNYSIEISVYHIKNISGFSYKEIGLQLDILKSRNLIDDVYSDIQLILDSNLLEKIIKG